MFNYYVVYFIVLSFIGYIYECTAMTMWSGKWDNRGFLYGPIIPIYGFGAFIGLLIFGGVFKTYTPIQVFLTGFIMSIVLEYPTSYILEKLFHAVWWDYSIAPFNINGRVSLFSSLGFGIGALAIVYIINPYLWPWILGLNENLVQIFSLFSMMIIGADMTLTINSLSNFEKRVTNIQDFINDHMSERVENINPNDRSIKGAIKYTKENGLDRIADSMSYLGKKAVSRVIGFRSVSNEKIQNLMTRIKEKIDSKKK